MIRQINISNFRSIKEQSIPIKKLNILYGPNGAGKSSVMYAPYVFRNLCINPIQKLDSLFNLGFMNLGGFDNVTRIHKNKRSSSVKIGFKIDIEIAGKINDYNYSLHLAPDDVFGNVISFNTVVGQATLLLDIPSSLFQKVEVKFRDYSLLWNGFTFETTPDMSGREVEAEYNAPYDIVKNIELISVKRGFFSPIFSTEQPTEESLFALTIRNQEKDFESKIDHYFKQIFDKTFRFVAIPGSTSFYLRTQNKSGLTTDLVNEGFGVNQTIYMLIKLLKQSTSLAFIEEPEIHLHPSAQNKLVDVFTEIIQKESKQIFLTTHSENIVSCALNKIAKGELNINDVQFLLAKVEDGETKIIPQTVNERGQIEGGLLSFMETELSNLKTLLGI